MLTEPASSTKRLGGRIYRYEARLKPSGSIAAKSEGESTSGKFGRFQLTAELRDIEVPTALLEDLGGVVVLTNFKIPSFAGFTGAIKNIGIGLVSPDAKALVHGADYQRIPGFFTRMADAAAGIKQYFGPRLICISLLTDMKASAFAGVEPQAGTLGIVGSLDPTAVDQAACDLLWHLTREQESTLSLQEKIDSGYLQLECMAAIGSGSRRYQLTALDK